MKQTALALCPDVPSDAAEDTSTQQPHPIPYQGSKRRIASTILRFLPTSGTRVLFEPFAGSAAFTIAAASKAYAKSYHINDSLEPLAALWTMIISEPEQLSKRYEQIWNGHVSNAIEHFYVIRTLFNKDGDPAKLLYLLTRCVKSAIRFNDKGEFNQSVDKRRLGARPERMRREIFGAHRILGGSTCVSGKDYRDVLLQAKSADFVYMDPPWQGTSGSKDTRYHQLLDRDMLIGEMERLNTRGVPFALSFDGRLGNKTYGDVLPPELKLTHVEICAGVSSQATLSGLHEVTYESLYVSNKATRAISPDLLRNLVREHRVGG